MDVGYDRDLHNVIYFEKSLVRSVGVKVKGYTDRPPDKPQYPQRVCTARWAYPHYGKREGVDLDPACWFTPACRVVQASLPLKVASPQQTKEPSLKRRRKLAISCLWATTRANTVTDACFRSWAYFFSLFYPSGDKIRARVNKLYGTALVDFR